MLALKSTPSDGEANRVQKCVIGRYFHLYFSVHFRPNFTPHSLPHLSPYAYLDYVRPLMSFKLTNKRQEHDSIGTTRHRTTHLLGYRHSETVLLWSLLTRILRWNLFCRHQMLPPLKIPDFLDTEHK